MLRASLVLTVLIMPVAIHCTPVSAAEPDCSVWHLETVRVGMTLAEIQESIGERAKDAHLDRYTTGIGWPNEPPVVKEPREEQRWDYTWGTRGHKRMSFSATFEVDPREDPSARATRLKAHWQQSPFESFAEAGVPNPDVVTALLTQRFGEPVCRVDDLFFELSWRSRECATEASYYTGSFGAAYTTFHSWIVIASPGLIVDSCRKGATPKSPLSRDEFDDLLFDKPRTR